MASIRGTKKCGKCGAEFDSSENVGSLKCFDRYFSFDKKLEFKVRADHRDFNGTSKKFNILNWEDWVWTFDDNVHIEKSIFEKLSYIPNDKAIIDIYEYEKLHSMYLNTMRINNEKDNTMLVPHHHQTAESSDESFFSDDSENDSNDDLNYNLSSISVIKTVCVARFDWREKFKVIQQIHTYDTKKSILKSKSASKPQKYYETYEYQNSREIQRQFRASKLGLS